MTYCSCNEPCYCLNCKPWKETSPGVWVVDEARMVDQEPVKKRPPVRTPLAERLRRTPED